MPTPGMDSADFIALNKLRGLSPRQQRLLELEAVYRGTQYEGLPPWEMEKADLGDGLGPRALCGHERNPTIKVGLIEEKVETLIDMTVGQGRFPKVSVTGTGLQEKLDRAKLDKRSRGPMRDLVVKGAMATEIAMLDGGQIELKHLRPEWCEPIFVAHVRRPRAGQIAAEIAGHAALAAPTPGDFLAVPEGASSDDLALLRYEYLFHTEEAVRAGASADTVAWWHRVDFTPRETIYYEDVKVYEDSARPEAWVVREIVTHNWGVVPVVWVRTPDAEDGEAEGPSLITTALRSIAEAADRSMTRKDESVAIVANPKAYTINLEDLVANYNREADKPPGWSASSGEVLQFQTAPNKEGKIGLLELAGPGPTAAKEHYADLVAEASRVSRVVSHDPQKVAGVQSGTALERMMEPTLQRAACYLVSLGEWIEGVARKSATMLGLGDVKVELAWPPRIKPTAEDQQALASSLSTATGGSPIISQETAVRLFAALVGVEDAKKEFEQIAADADSAMARAREAMSQRPSKAATPPGAKPEDKAKPEAS